MWRPLSGCLMVPRAGSKGHWDVRRVRLVVVEDGAQAVGSYLSAEECEETVVVHQSDDEPPAELARRVVGRIATLEGSGRAVARAVIMIANRTDCQAMAARHLLARALVMHAQVALAGSADLTFAVDGRDNIDLRRELMALVETLIGEPVSSPAIRVCFGPPEKPFGRQVSESGFFDRVRPELDGRWLASTTTACAGTPRPTPHAVRSRG